MRCTVGRVVGFGGLLASAIAAGYRKAADYSEKIAELQQALKASQEETRILQEAYKLLLAASASNTQQVTGLQNAAAGLRTCLSRAEHQQAQLQESLATYADYIGAADERIQQLEEDLAVALQESAVKAAHIERLESEVLRTRAKVDKQQASHSAQVQELKAKYMGSVDRHERLVRWYNSAARDAAGAEAARDEKAEQLALLQQQLDSMKACITNGAGCDSIRSSYSNSSTTFLAPRSRTQSDGSNSSDSSGRRSSSSSQYGASAEGSGSACCDCGECASCTGALSTRAAELHMLCDVSLTSKDEGSDSDSYDEADGSRNPRVKGTTGFSLDMGKLAAFNTFGDNYQQDPTAVSLVHVLQRRGVAAVSVPNLKAALQHITDSSCGFEAFSQTAADVFVGACEAFAVEQPTGGDTAAALQAAAVAEAGASEIVHAEGAADWWGSEAMRMAGAVVACGGPVLAAVEMQQLLSGVEQLSEKLDSLAEVFHALPVLADILFA